MTPWSIFHFGPTGTLKTKSTHKYCPCAPVALMVPSIRRVTHSYAKVIGIPGVSRCAGDGLVIVRTAITPGREGLFGSVFEVSDARNPGVRAAGNRGSVASGRSLPKPANARAAVRLPARGIAARRRTAKSRWPRRSQLPPRGERADGGRGPLPPSIGGRGPFTPTRMDGRPRRPRGRPAEARRATHGTSGTKAPATPDARAEGGSGAAQGTRVGSAGAERRKGRGSDPRERSGARDAGRIRGRGSDPGTGRQEAGSPRAGPGATGFGWAPPYLRSRLA